VSFTGLCCKEGQQSGGATGVAAQGGAEVAVALGPQDAEARLRRLAMALGALLVPIWEASSAKVASRMWCSTSIPQ
jgi:hypothetical protein